MLIPEIIPISQYQIPQKQSVFDLETIDTVSKIIRRVMNNGDTALKEITSEIDRIMLDSFLVPAKKIEAAVNNLDYQTKTIFKRSIANIREYHEKTTLHSWSYAKDDQSALGMKITPIDRVGLYVPGGRAIYPSTVFMNAIPAQLAGVPSIALFSPPMPNGIPHELVLACCGLLGISEVYGIGGAQSVAAMAFGTDSIKPVYKICGPGNKYVTEAKRQVFGTVGIDSIAGPSEIIILHDDPDIPPEYPAYDMMAQAEHDKDAKAMFITVCPDTARAVQRVISSALPNMKRQKIIAASLEKHGQIIVCDTLEDGAELVNQLAPEHLELMLKNESDSQLIRNAGAIFIGKWSGVALGDYIAGPNHTLPTERSAMYTSPLSVADFQKKTSVIKYSESLFKQHAEYAAQFADAERFHAHAESLRQRLD